MRFFQSALLAVSALASMTLAQSTTLFFTQVPTSVTVGNSYTLEWKTADTTTPVTITLRKGPAGTLQTISTLTSTATGGTYTWIPDKSLADGSDYALMITQGNQINYSGHIALSGGSPSAISSAASASASSSASAASVSQSVLSLTTITGNSTASATASISAASTGKGNSTVSTATLSVTAKTTIAATSGSTGTQTASQGAPTGAAGQLGSSPVALIFGAVAAMVYLN
ncbi:hypothetical protein AOQ84DRAFT_68994 [Glonium stellatum]|uniref:Yeast cell wall synthesis Kre9/Knh1-like N-terminal domain-containing protein n=1 Tax=Glonium stellatum TaxID=574774 RepID=A0A8E2JRI2_9PEZI|nr:hypothetical protein AOQ84DRAFT_68994 [Glonium stellatum]